MGFSFPDLCHPLCPCCLLTMGSLWPGSDPCQYFSKYPSAILVNSVSSQRIYWKLLGVTITLSEVWGLAGEGEGEMPLLVQHWALGGARMPLEVAEQPPGEASGDKGFGSRPREKRAHFLLHPTHHCNGPHSPLGSAGKCVCAAAGWETSPKFLKSNSCFVGLLKSSLTTPPCPAEVLAQWRQKFLRKFWWEQ